MVTQHGADDLLRVLVVKHAAVTSVGQRSEPGSHVKLVSRQTPFGAELGRLKHIAMPGFVLAIGLQQAQRDLFAQQTLKFKVCGGRKALQFKLEGLAH